MVHSEKAVDGPSMSFVCFRHITVSRMQTKKEAVTKETPPALLSVNKRDRPRHRSTLEIRNISQSPLELSINGYIKPCLPPAIVSSTLDPTSSDYHTVFTSQYSVSSNLCITLPLIISFTYIKTRHYSKNAVPVARLRDGLECHTRCSD
jgi:hypothetical protein